MKKVFVACICCLSIIFMACPPKQPKLPPPPEVKKELPPPPPVQPPVQKEPEEFKTTDPNEEIKAALQTLYFDYDRYDLRSDALQKLATIGKFLSARSSIRILIEGHADERGSAEYNIGLGNNRSKAVENWLISYGIGKTRVEITSFGKERPAFPNCGDDEQCHAKNRRVEFKVLAQ